MKNIIDRNWGTSVALSCLPTSPIGLQISTDKTETNYEVKKTIISLTVWQKFGMRMLQLTI
jgi:hypothetical protein